MGEITAPTRLTAEHDIECFDCSEESLNNWLKTRALKNEAQGASRTYVVCIDMKVIGYYALAVGSIENSEAVSKVKRNMPNPIPVMILGRLAVDKNWHNHGIGKGLLKDAVLRTVAAAEYAGIKALLVHALSKEAVIFYKYCGFKESPINKSMLMITVKEAQYAFMQQATATEVA